MNEYLDIFNDVIRLATLQPRWRERHALAPRIAEPSRDRPRAGAALGRRFEVPERIS
jgi:hypothetical protein